MILNASAHSAKIRCAVESLDDCKKTGAGLKANVIAVENELSDLKRTASSSDENAVSAISRKSVRLELLRREISDSGNFIENSQAALTGAMAESAKFIGSEISAIFNQQVEDVLPLLVPFYRSESAARDVLRSSPFGEFIRLKSHSLFRGLASTNPDAINRRLAELDTIGNGQIPWPWPQ